MKILLDENLPHDLRHFLPHHEVFTVAYMKWRGVENGALIAQASKHDFDVFISRDSGIEFEQNLGHLPVAVILLGRRCNTMDDIKPLLPVLVDAITTIKPNTLLRIG